MEDEFEEGLDLEDTSELGLDYYLIFGDIDVFVDFLFKDAYELLIPLLIGFPLTYFFVILYPLIVLDY